jgi:hypothetical protein
VVSFVCMIFYTPVLQRKASKCVKKCIVYFLDRIFKKSVISFSKSDGKGRRVKLRHRKFEILYRIKAEGILFQFAGSVYL